MASIPAAPGKPAPGAWTAWTNLWQIPAIVISLALIVMGVSRTIGPPQTNDFTAAFHQIDQLIAASQFETARSMLRDMIEPNLGETTTLERGRFHATVAELLFVAQQSEGTKVEATHRRVGEQFAQALKLEFPLTPGHIERWAQALLAFGDLAGARERLKQLDAMLAAAKPSEGEGDAANPVRVSRNRVFRNLVDVALRRSDVPGEGVGEMISDYRNGGELSAEDEVWSIARLAELKLNAGQAQEAVQSLLVDMRRLEGRGFSETAPNFGELFVLLGRAYFDLGDYARSQDILDQAMHMLDDSQPAFGDALVVIGRIAQARNDPDAAAEKFDLVVRDYVGTPSYLPGLLGRAETRSILGDHEESQADYETLKEDLAKSEGRRDITALVAGRSLCDRHDAALALGNLERALAYVSLAESLFKSDEVTADVLLRLASTHRQLADNMLALADSAGDESPPTEPPAAPAEVRTKANGHFAQAGDYYLRHANSHDAARLDDREWATSLWLAADSFDKGGRQEQAAKYFLRYLDGGSIDDPRRPETLHRLGQAYQAQLDYENGAAFYEQLVADHPRSTYAAHSHVPLSQCYLALDRRPEAEQQLRDVLAGNRLLTPEAQDYRDALIELGSLHYAAGEFAPAIERYTEASERYPDDPRRMEILYRLADSYRGSAMNLEERLKQPPPLPPSEQGRINAQRIEQLQRALDLFAEVCDTFGTSTAAIDAAQVEVLRRAHLYRADCAFHLGFYELAIEHYDRAARQYSTHASSMYALVQIVNCYTLLNDSERAAAAHRRALVRLKQLPETAFDSSEALMDRAAWERWLDHSPVGNTLASGAHTG